MAAGDNMRFRIKTLTSNTGDVVTVPIAGITCIVGANNAGKSQLLRDVRAIASEVQPHLKTLSAVDAIEPSGAQDDLRAYLERTAARTEGDDGQPLFGAAGLGNYSLQQLSEFLEQGSGVIGSPWASILGPLFVAATSAGSLRDYSTSQISTSDQVNSSPLSKMFRDGDLEESIAQLSLAAFGQPVVLDRLSPSMVLRVGAVQVPVPPLNRPTQEYATAVSALPKIANEGDGLKSFIGLALLVLADSDRLLLVDEPEAFLHPAQARALGRWMAKQASERGCQIILSTHDRDLLLGLVEGGSQVNVVRVTRNSNETHLSQLPPEEVAKVWNSPVLRYSNVLQGLFHAQVVICESDADCRFFSAALDELDGDGASRAAIADNTLFVPAGGKDREHQLADALASLDVRTFAIADFDVLNKRATVKRLVESLGATWTDDMQRDYVVVSSAVNTIAASADDGWQLAKNAGLSVIPSGEATVAARSLLDQFSDAGLIVLPMGEMEDFDKAVTLHGAPWVTTALDKGVHRASAVRDVVRRLTNG
jgi:predicted ATPase